MPALLLPTVHGSRVEASVADPANHLVAVVLLGQQPQRGLDHAAPQSQHLHITDTDRSHHPD